LTIRLRREAAAEKVRRREAAAEVDVENRPHAAGEGAEKTGEGAARGLPALGERSEDDGAGRVPRHVVDQAGGQLDEIVGGPAGKPVGRHTDRVQFDARPAGFVDRIKLQMTQADTEAPEQGRRRATARIASDAREDLRAATEGRQMRGDVARGAAEMFVAGDDVPEGLADAGGCGARGVGRFTALSWSSRRQARIKARAIEK